MTLPEITFHIFPTDCDVLGHLNHATMLAFMERARWAFLEPHLNLREWHREEVFPVVRRLEIEYRAQTLPGEDLTVRSGLAGVGRTSWTIRQQAHKADGTIAADARLVFVTVDRRGVPVPVPDAWRSMVPSWPEEPT